MKIAFVGKGGSGKTTLAALFARYLAESGRPVVAIDADINQHLATALGVHEDTANEIPPLGRHIDEIKEILRGDNPRIASSAAMTKTTPPGRGSRLLDLGPDNPLHRRFGATVNGATLMLTGPFSEDDLGTSCYHSKVGAVELYLNHLVDGQGEYVVVDMTAGADSFASGLFTRFDVTFLVAEPTVRGVSVHRQYADYARGHDVTIHVVGNKVRGDDDVDFLTGHVGDALLTHLGQSEFVHAMEKGRHPRFSDLEPENLKALGTFQDTVDATAKDWVRFTRQGIEFHLRNARRWAGTAEAELVAQVDPDFVLDASAGPARCG